MSAQWVDASEWQLDIEIAVYPLPRIAHRATYGDDGTDRRFVGRWPTFTGKIRQAYHFAYPGNPAGAAAHFLAVVESVGGFAVGDEAMLDLEYFQNPNGAWQGLPPAQAKDYARTFLAAMPSTVRRFLYGNAWYFEAAGITEADFPNVGLIIASYGSGYRTPAGWSHTCGWQSTSTASVPGFPGEQVDLNTVVCPTNLVHLTIGDEVTPEDRALIRADNQADLANAVKFILSAVLGAIPPGEKAPASLGAIKSELNVILGAPKPDGTDGDPTHFGLGDIGRMVTAVPALAAAETVQAVTPAIETAVSHAAQNPSLAGLTGTFTVEAAK